MVHHVWSVLAIEWVNSYRAAIDSSKATEATLKFDEVRAALGTCIKREL